MRKVSFLVAIIGFLVCGPDAESSQAKIKNISSPKNLIKQYEPFEADIILPAKQIQPQEMTMDAEITAPGGKTAKVPAFYSGKNFVWKIRYTPLKAGNYSYRLKLKTPSETLESDKLRFWVIPNKAKGFLRKGSLNPYYPIFDSGEPFFGIGHNIGWISDNNLAEYETYFSLFKQNGCNITRIWINSPWTFKIETKKLGIYNVEDSGKLDQLLTLAGKYGIYIILVLDAYGSLMDERGNWNEEWWKINPYNRINGGPCEKPWDFFTNEEAREHYKKRLRYIIARWGYSPNILAFELWNEVDAPVEWTREMASYLKSINPHGQFVTTSLGYPWGNNFDESAIWRLDEIGIINRHLYENTTKDMTENTIFVTRELSKRYDKCVVIGEFGMDVSKNDAEIDDAGSGVALHKSLWASVVARSFATSLNWWWAEYVKAKNLYPHYKAVSNFVRGVKWGSGPVEFLPEVYVKCMPDNNACTFSNVAISTNDAWGETSYREFSVDDNGTLSGGVVNAYLHGLQKREMRIEPIFYVNYPTDGKFVVRINMVSQGANLIIYLDGKKVLNMEFPAGAGAGPWKRSLYRKDHNIYECIYDSDVSIDVPRGEHVIKLSNNGPDWIRIKNISLVNYISSLFANTGAAGLRVNDEMLLWIYNKDYNWKNTKKGLTPPLIKGASLTIGGAENGSYEIEWWDTFKGKILTRQRRASKDNELTIAVPDFTTDLACKIKKIRG